jgi:hypothetical protein
MTTKEQFVQLAWNAVTKAEELASDAQRYASGDERHKAEPIAATGSLWADIARTYTAIAAVLPEPLPELPTGGTEY